MKPHDNEFLITICANFGHTNSERAAARTHNIKLKEKEKNERTSTRYKKLPFQSVFQ